MNDVSDEKNKRATLPLLLGMLFAVILIFIYVKRPQWRDGDTSTLNIPIDGVVTLQLHLDPVKKIKLRISQASGRYRIFLIPEKDYIQAGETGKSEFNKRYIDDEKEGNAIFKEVPIPAGKYILLIENTGQAEVRGKLHLQVYH